MRGRTGEELQLEFTPLKALNHLFVSGSPLWAFRVSHLRLGQTGCSMRFKNRYLLCELEWLDGKTDSSVNGHTLFSVIRESVLLNFGEFGLGNTLQSLQGRSSIIYPFLNISTVKYFNALTGIAIVRVSRESADDVTAAITLINELKSSKVALRVIHSAGTIRCAQLACIALHSKLLHSLSIRQPNALQLAYRSMDLSQSISSSSEMADEIIDALVNSATSEILDVA